MDIPVINGLNYAWGDIRIMLFGTLPLVGVKSIDYGEEQDMEDNYGAGNFPVSQGLGQFKFTGSIELYREELKKIIQVAPIAGLGPRISLIPAFPIKVTYGNDSQALTVDTLTNVRFATNPFSSKSGDKSITCKVKLLIGNIISGV